jgi:hypothetical protein
LVGSESLLLRACKAFPGTPIQTNKSHKTTKSEFEISKPKPIHVFLPTKAESNAKKSKQEITQT